MNIENLLRICRHEVRRKQTHVSGKTNEVNFGFFQGGNNLPIVSFAFKAFRRNYAGCEATRFGLFNTHSGFAIANDKRNLCARDAARGNGVGKGFKIRASAAQEHANALSHKQKTLAQKRDEPKLESRKLSASLKPNGRCQITPRSSRALKAAKS